MVSKSAHSESRCMDLAGMDLGRVGQKELIEVVCVCVGGIEKTGRNGE